MSRNTPLRWFILATLLTTTGCGPDGAPNARRLLLEEHVPRIKELVRQDREKTRRGVSTAAARFARGFGVADPASRENQMRTALNRVQEPPRGIPEFIASPMSFLTAVGADGVVIARDGQAENDRMKGIDFGERYEVIRTALSSGQPGYELAEFGGGEGADESSFSMMFVAPSRANGEVVGVMAAGIPLWREAQRLSRQLRLDHAQDIQQGLVLWAYIYKGDRVFASPEAPNELTNALPDAATRRAGLERSTGGFTGDIRAFHKWYGYAVVPLTGIGDDVGLIVVRADIPE